MHETPNKILTPEPIETKQIHDANDAWEHINSIYTSSIAFLRSKFQAVLTEQSGHQRCRAFYPEIRLTTTTYDQIDSRLSFGHVPGPGRYSITVTRPDLFKNYLTQQMALLIENHKVAIEVAVSKTAIPIHFAMELRARLRFISGAALGPPPRTHGAPQLPDGKALDDPDFLLAFAKAALAGQGMPA